MTCNQKGNRESKGDVAGRKRHVTGYYKYALHTLGIYKKTWTQRKEKQKMQEKRNRRCKKDLHETCRSKDENTNNIPDRIFKVSDIVEEKIP